MPKSELAEESNAEMEQAGPPGPIDMLIGVAGAVSLADLQQRATEALNSLPASVESSRVVVAYPDTYPGNGGGNGEVDVPVEGNKASSLRFLPYSLPASDPGSMPWTVVSSAQRALCSLAIELDVKVCILLHSDLSMLRADRLQLLRHPIIEKQSDLVLPIYPSRKFEGLLNHSILAPLARALYGKRVRYPLAQDFSCSSRMFEKLSETQRDSLLWPATLAVLEEYQLCQVSVDAHHAAQTEGLELSTVLTSLVGSAFAEMETYAAQWQRVRGSQFPAAWGNTVQHASDGDPVDVKPLIDSFLIGSENLQEIWRLVLPPVTLLELKKLTRLSPEAFRMPDELWVRIIYDFALAHRLRTISRGHLLGALTPLYLGWVASYVQQVTAASPMAAEQRLEQLARAYEEGKPYLLSRWRWPDRFNP